MSKKKNGMSIFNILMCPFIICLCITLILVILRLSLFPAIPWIVTLIPMLIFFGIFLLTLICCVLCSAIMISFSAIMISFMENKTLREKTEEIRRENNK